MFTADFLSQPAATVGAVRSGSLYVVRCEPDPYTGERLNIGVFGIDPQGKRRARMVHQAGRLECLYGDAANSIVRLAKVAEESAMKGSPPPSPQLTYDGPMPFFNTSLEDAVDRAFADLVTVAIPYRETTDGTKVTDDDARAQVINAVKSLIGLDMELLANTPQVIINTDRGPWTVSIPLQPRHGVGTILSTDYAPQTLKSHLMDRLLDLEFAAHHKEKRSMGLFLLRPMSGGIRNQRAINAVIDNVAHRAPRKLHLEVADTATALAHHVKAWGAMAS